MTEISRPNLSWAQELSAQGIIVDRAEPELVGYHRTEHQEIKDPRAELKTKGRIDLGAKGVLSSFASGRRGK